MSTSPSKKDNIIARNDIEIPNSSQTLSAIIIEEKDNKLMLAKVLLELFRIFEIEHNSPEELKESKIAQKIINNAHPDVRFIFKAADKTAISIGQIKKISQFISLYPFEATTKSVIFLNAQDMTTEAQNALLKNLEDHSQTTNFFLGVNSRKRLLPTIISRCSIKQIAQDDFNNLEKLAQELPSLYSFTQASEVGQDDSDISEVEKRNLNLNNMSLTDLDQLMSQKNQSKRDLALELVQNTLKKEREYLREIQLDRAGKHIKNIEYLTKALSMINKNTNPRLVVENYIIQNISDDE